MPSLALMRWQSVSASRLQRIDVARLTAGGRQGLQRIAAEQIKHAYVILLSSHFQAYCRDLHTEAVDCLCPAIAPGPVQGIVKLLMTRDRKLDRGNPNPGNIGSDFSRFNFNFWHEVIALDAKNADRQRSLEAFNAWRNAIAHQDFAPAHLGGAPRLTMSTVSAWHSDCNRLAIAFDRVICRRLTVIIGRVPW